MMSFILTLLFVEALQAFGMSQEDILDGDKTECVPAGGKIVQRKSIYLSVSILMTISSLQAIAAVEKSAASSALASTNSVDFIGFILGEDRLYYVLMKGLWQDVSY
ncbi:uncharacterized protein TRUGW13939_10703 [Talaromyces rugulosus]|uniref:Uncharacterized protein n=1 Tax=Talaromyces rugulosus TaxID=121627 RepID=A0A7H8RAU1_TALRU|nr:uncharacterized protein TRUGW13939_10703 [Talaromyces rugulosus]QKX63532.1 hypothetical protein TRUGW13939_10703 [Talaromyces rugulosus]